MKRHPDLNARNSARLSRLLRFASQFDPDGNHFHFKTVQAGLARDSAWFVRGGRITAATAFIIREPLTRLQALRLLRAFIVEAHKRLKRRYSPMTADRLVPQYAEIPALALAIEEEEKGDQKKQDAWAVLSSDGHTCIDCIEIGLGNVPVGLPARTTFKRWPSWDDIAALPRTIRAESSPAAALLRGVEAGLQGGQA